MAGSGELWVQCFTCCLTQQGPRARNGKQRSHQRLRIDRSMIGVPTNFRHTGHISSGDLDMTSAELANIQAQMQRKGGYETTFGVKVLTAASIPDMLKMVPGYRLNYDRKGTFTMGQAEID